jgi:hypothetical protein
MQFSWFNRLIFELVVYSVSIMNVQDVRAMPEKWESGLAKSQSGNWLD